MKSFLSLKQFIFFFSVVILLSSCQKKTSKSFTILAINDVYRAQGLDGGKVGGLARVKTIREKIINQEQKVLVLHAGDFLQPSFSSRVNKGAAMIDAMNQLNGGIMGFDKNMIVTFGNHEFDKAKLKYLPQLQARIDESEFTWLDSNINWLRDDKLGQIHANHLKKWTIVERGGIKVGVFSLTTNMTQPEYISSFDDPIEVTKHYVPFLRSQGAQIVIALTHQQLPDDKLVLQVDAQYRPDIIIGGHEHYRQLEQVNNTWIVKADADALSVATIDITLDKSNNISVLPVFIDLDESVKKNTHVQQTIENWTQKTKVKYCKKINEGSECLDEAYGSTKVELIAEESEIRRFETNMGNFIADTALAEFKLCHADIALINSGSVRLNYNIAANSNITRKHIEGMFPYPSNLKQIRITGKILKQMLTHTIDKWTANGHWLLVSGIKYTHNPKTQQFSNLKYTENKNDIEVLDSDLINIIVPQYLIDAKTDHDGYTMIDENMIMECNKNGSSLKQLVINRIKNTPHGINPQKQGRICNTLRDDCSTNGID